MCIRDREWDQLKDGPFVWNEQIKKDIDANIIRAYDFESFIVGLENQGYQIKYGKYLAIKPPEMKKFRRLKTLGEGYSEEDVYKRQSQRCVFRQTVNYVHPIQPALVIL